MVIREEPDPDNESMNSGDSGDSFGSDDNVLEPEYQLADSKDRWVDLKDNLISLLDQGLRQLNHIQAKIVGLVSNSIDKIKEGLVGLKLLVMGKAGTGKSFLIKMINLLARAKFCEYDYLPIIRCAHTGIYKQLVYT